MKKIFYLSLSVLLIFGLAACNRTRQRNNPETSAPAPAATQASSVEPTQTPVPAATEVPTEAPTSAPAQPEPSATVAPTQAQQSSAAATAAADLDKALDDLEKLLNNTDTNVEVP